MSKLSTNLTARRESLGLTVPEVHQELNRRGFPLAFSTVAGWFNGSRGERWKVDELRALLDVLQTDFETISEGEVEMVEGATKATLAREIGQLSTVQQEALLAMVKSMRGNG